jgi:hypothetical protein
MEIHRINLLQIDFDYYNFNNVKRDKQLLIVDQSPLKSNTSYNEL